MSRYETKLKSKLHDEIKLAGFQALVPEELEKLILNANRLRTFGESAPGNRDVCRGEGRPEDQRCKTCRNMYVVYNRILWTSMQPRKRRRVYMAGASSVVVLTLNATALHAKARASNRLAEACRAASHDPRAKGKARATKEKPKGKSKGVQGAKHSNEKLRSS